jgi:hypothetical protein
MTETAADEQDLVKALDSVANAASNLGDSGESNTVTAPQSDSNGSLDLPPIVPLDSPVAPQAIGPARPVFPTANDNNNNRDDDNSPVVAPSDNSDSDAPTDDNPTVDDSDTAVSSGPLDDIKKDALNELRPLVDKLNVSPEEKFDTLLLLIRSTDDADLIGPAHEAAKSISDEARRAEALLDIIKEIDYLSHQKSN